MTDELKTLKHRCSVCDLEVEEIQKFKEGECPFEMQHYFVEVEDLK